MFSLGIYDKVTTGALTGGQNIAGTGPSTAPARSDRSGGSGRSWSAPVRVGRATSSLPADNCDEVSGAVPDGLQAIRVATFDDAKAALDQISAGDPKNLPGLLTRNPCGSVVEGRSQRRHQARSQVEPVATASSASCARWRIRHTD